MGLFKRKSDPISERARTLNQEIAALEAQIKELSAQEAQTPAGPKTPPQSPTPKNHHPQKPVQAASPQPRLRSTAIPHHRHTAAAVPPPPASHEPVFEEVDR